MGKKTKTLAEIINEIIRLPEEIPAPLYISQNINQVKETIIKDIVCDSRKAQADSIFVAIAGYKIDGHKFISSAIEKGACLIVFSDLQNDSMRISEYGELDAWCEKHGVAALVVSDTRLYLAYLSAIFFDWPAANMDLVGVTGTNGKTSITYILEHIWRKQAILSGVIGTISYRWPGHILDSTNTTPESRFLLELVDEMRTSAVQRVAMEASSHALSQSRLAAIQFKTAVFTNLTQDHLDYHASMEDYFSAKKKLFLPSSLKGDAVIFIDNPYGKKLAEKLLFIYLANKDRYVYTLSYASNPWPNQFPAQRHYQILNAKYSLAETAYTLITPEQRSLSIRTPLIGGFNVVNTALSFLAALSLGDSEEVILAALADRTLSVPGRFQVAEKARSKGVVAVVDYAHTPDALENVLTAAIGLKPKRLICVFGCGGDRDRTKRPLMGKISTRLADFTFVTSDNPRTEMPDAIIQEIVAPLVAEEVKNFSVVVDRREAIRRALNYCQLGDMLVVAGKGHENYQIIRTEKFHFDDLEEISNALD